MVCYANTGGMIAEIDAVLDAQPNSFFRVGTGEWADSMALDHITHYSQVFVPYFAQKQNAILEIKTKTDNIANLLDLEHNGRVVVSWSMNSKMLSQAIERNSAALEDRLSAALRCIGAGYRVAFHFDPLIRHEDMTRHYADTVNAIFDAVPESSIAWISLGALRFPPALKEIIEQRFPHSRFIYDEFVRGEDGKMRYFRPVRVEMYQSLVHAIRARSKTTSIYLCMETPQVWRDVFGFTPCQRELSGTLDRAAVSCISSSR